ncbi:hypothetical protein AB0K20_23315 [Micromonospora matsumotoense]|uniref:hypothetical protein n=1 Tax=Micromonospora matsumotoense TaxID=121616 RepID=UPI0034430097
MELDAVVAEVRQALGTIGLSLPEWGVQRIHPPAAMVALPERIAFDQTYGRGSDSIEGLPVLVLVARPTSPEARREIAEYAAGAGPKSVKAAIEAHQFTAADEVTVVSAEFDVVTLLATEYLVAQFNLDIVGRGA